jgi:SPASM domain peptide maturase of grasp-with-spasm system
MKEQYMVLNSSVFLTKGKTRSLIFHSGKDTFDLIPNGLFDLLTQFNYQRRDDLFNSLDMEDLPVVREYLDFLLEKKYIHYTDSPDHFPPNDTAWHSHSEISNAIIDFNRDLDYQHAVNDLSALGCKSLQIRVFDRISLDALSCLMFATEPSRIKSIEIIVPFSIHTEESKCKVFFAQYSKVLTMFIFSAEKKEIIAADNSKLRTMVYVKENIANALSCGIIHPNYFSTDAGNVREAISHNSCLNKKISIDYEGNIKNCPSMKKSFGNIRDSALTSAMGLPAFKEFWNINKEKIKGCSECEFRLICSDCRAYTEDPADRYSKPLKCGYDPETNTWEDWSKNPLKQRAIAHYKMEHLTTERS